MDPFRREFLKLAGFGSGCHSFDFALPVGLTPDTIEVRRSLDGAVLMRTTRARAA